MAIRPKKRLHKMAYKPFLAKNGFKPHFFAGHQRGVSKKTIRARILKDHRRAVFSRVCDVSKKTIRARILKVG